MRPEENKRKKHPKYYVYFPNTLLSIRKNYKKKLNTINPINNGNPFYPLLMR